MHLELYKSGAQGNRQHKQHHTHRYLYRSHSNFFQQPRADKGPQKSGQRSRNDQPDTTPIYIP